ncbi:MAG TPA: hypothetical protein PKI55_08175 [Chitinophagaceae bacterium]|nr:hypothetical protein [Chitinophagaceae bacterium]
MKTLLAFLVCSLLLITFTATAQNEPSPQAEAFYNKAMAEINSKHVRWIKTTAAEVNEKKLSDADVMTRSKSYGVLGNMNGQDIEAIAFLVLMQASKSAQEDLKAIMAKVKSINEQKAKLRNAMNKINSSRTISNVQLDSFHLVINQSKALQKGNNPDTVKLARSASGKSTVNKKELDAIKEKMKGDLDSMSEMGEMESLRLQSAMDRMSKMNSTLSNLLKKIHDTQQSIIQNLK